jgi:hypothetical protein
MVLYARALLVDHNSEALGCVQTAAGISPPPNRRKRTKRRRGAVYWALRNGAEVAICLDLIQPGCEPMDLMNPIVDRRDFDHAFPSLAIRICGDVTLPKDSA